MEIYLLTKYVDDVLVLCKNLDLGAHYKDGRIQYSTEVKELHVLAGKSRSEVTLGILQQLANEVLDFLKFTGECSIGDTPIPVLDCQMWSGSPANQEQRQWYTGSQTLDIEPEQNQRATVLYKFFEKPMASQHSMLQ